MSQPRLQPTVAALVRLRLSACPASSALVRLRCFICGLRWSVCGLRWFMCVSRHPHTHRPF